MYFIINSNEPPRDAVHFSFYVPVGPLQKTFLKVITSYFLNDDLDETEPVTDDEIIRQVTQECDGESEEMFHVEPVVIISHSSVVSALNTCLKRADQVGYLVPEKMLLRKLRDKAFYLTSNISRQLKH